MAELKLTSEQAWCDHIRDATKLPKWLEDSKNISEELPVSKRELLGLILLSHVFNCENNGDKWYVGYDAADGQPNDGFVSDGTTKMQIEHKIVPQMNKHSALEGILSTYKKYAKKGKAYGENRTLLIHVNKETVGLIRVTSLRDEINKTENCQFDQVFMASCGDSDAENAIFNIIDQYRGKGFAHVTLNKRTGLATVHESFKFLRSADC